MAFGLGCGVYLLFQADQRQRKAEQLRQNEVEKRQAELLQVVSAHEGEGRTHLAAGRFREARDALGKALACIRNEPRLGERLAALDAQHERIDHLAKFYKHVDDAWFLAGDVDGPTTTGALAANAAALQDLGVLTRDNKFAPSEWWDRFPDADLDEKQRGQLQEEVYRQLVLTALLRLREGVMPLLARLEKDGVLSLLPKKDPPAADHYRAALRSLEQAQAWERFKGNPPAVFPTCILGKSTRREKPAPSKIGRLAVSELPLVPPSASLIELNKETHFHRRRTVAADRHVLHPRVKPRPTPDRAQMIIEVAKQDSALRSQFDWLDEVIGESLAQQKLPA